MQHSTDLTSIEVRIGSKSYFLILIIICAGLFALNYQNYLDNGVFDIKKITFHQAFDAALLIIAIAGSIYVYLDKRIKVSIDNNGIWTKKYDTVPWRDISYFNSSVSVYRGEETNYLTLFLKETADRFEREVTIPFSSMDKKFTEIRNVVVHYATKYNIRDMGHYKRT